MKHVLRLNAVEEEGLSGDRNLDSIEISQALLNIDHKKKQNVYSCRYWKIVPLIVRKYIKKLN